MISCSPSCRDEREGVYARDGKPPPAKDGGLSRMDEALPTQSEGDINRSPQRAAWQAAALDDTTRKLLEEDARYFLHQSLSTPCLNALRRCEGIYVEDL